MLRVFWGIYIFCKRKSGKLAEVNKSLLLWCVSMHPFTIKKPVSWFYFPVHSFFLSSFHVSVPVSFFSHLCFVSSDTSLLSSLMLNHDFSANCWFTQPSTFLFWAWNCIKTASLQSYLNVAKQKIRFLLNAVIRDLVRRKQISTCKNL